MAKKFALYHKQATIGPCNMSKPPFWQRSSRAKYDAWKALGKMDKKEAMKCYVNEFKKVN